MNNITHLKRSFEDGVQFAWDSTSINLAATCMRKYYYTMIRGIQPSRKSVHLVFGGLYATALEHFYKHRALGDDIQEALRKVVLEALIDSWDFETGVAKSFDHAAKTRVNLIRTIVWYVEQFAEETEDGLKTHILQNGEPAVELSFNFEVDDDIVLCGHLDRVSEMGEKQFYVVDQKTTGGTVGTYFFDGFSPDTQMSLYTMAGAISFHTPIRGVIIDAAQIAVGFTRFERGITTRSKAQLDEWLESTLHIVRVARELTSQEFFPMNTTACGNYGGCAFRQICRTSPQMREAYIQGDYVEHNWDPLEER